MENGGRGVRIAVGFGAGLALAVAAGVGPSSAEPCRGEACRVVVALDDGLFIPAYASHSLRLVQPQLRRAVIVIHGNGRNARGYFRRMVQAAARAGKEAETLVIAPHFRIRREAAAEPAGAVFWDRNDEWKQGDASAEVAGHRLSSFAAIDRLREYLRDRGVFPNLTRLVIVGHSAGGQFVQRYAVGHAANGAGGIAARYVVANPSSYMYFDDRRAGEDGEFRSGGSRGCRTNAYKYGPDGRNPYMSRLALTDMVARYRTLEVIYLIGASDSDPRAALLDRSCAALAQGPHRLARTRAYKRYMDLFFAPHRHRLVTVPDVGHSSRRMFLSDEGTAAIFGAGT